MSRIDRLIAELCPDGVEFKALADLAGAGFFSDGDWVEMKDQDPAGDIRLIQLADVGVGVFRYRSNRWMRRDQASRLDCTFLKAGDVLIARMPDPLGRACQVPDDIGSAVTVVDVAILRSIRADVLPRYAMYAINSHSVSRQMLFFQTGGTRQRISRTNLGTVRIPIPPLEVQREIVKVLDTFTQLEAELEAELEARRRQHQYYRDALLSFADQPDIRWATLGELGQFIRGRRFTKADYVETGIGCIHYGDIYTQYGTTAKNVTTHVRADMGATLRYAKPGDVVITDVGETVQDVGKSVAWLGTDEVAIHDHCYAFRHSMNPTFVAYCMQTTSFIAEKAKYVARTKVNTLLINGFAKIRIPVPPPEEQARIVSILDKFDALVNDLSSGLPAEIMARRQQYAHYRDRLLSFKEAT